MDAMNVVISGGLLKQLMHFNQTWDEKRSLNASFEDCLIAGIEAKRRSKEYSEATQNRKKFEREIANDPTIVLDPAKMLSLMKKYHIGASNEKLEAQVLAEVERRELASFEADEAMRTVPRIA